MKNTTTTPIRSTAIALMALTMVACTEDSTVPLSRLQHETAQAYCEQILSCAEFRRTAEGTALLALSPAFVEMCADFYEPELGLLAELRALVDEGRVRYDGGAASECLAALASSCVPEASFQINAACRTTFVGTQQAGEACSISTECEPGTYCTAEDVMGVCNAGVCVAQRALGDACDDARECPQPDGSGLAACRDLGGGTVCSTVTVTTGIGEGEPCGDLDTTGTEQAYGFCTGSFFCDDPDGDDRGVCRAPIAAGALCEPNEQACVQGAVCRDVAGENRCVTITAVTTVGGSCDDDTVLCDYPGRLVCQSGECVEIAAGSCEEAFHCEPGEYCDDNTNMCAARKALGSECDSSSECQSDYCRDDGTMTGTRRCQERTQCG